MAKMKKVATRKDFVIAEDENGFYSFTKDEWSMGDGFRYAEMEHGSEDEAKMFIDCYGSEDEPDTAAAAPAGKRAAKLKKDQEYHVGTFEIGSILRGIHSLREAKAAAAQWAKYLPCTETAFVAKFAAGTDEMLGDFDVTFTGKQMVERKEVERAGADLWYVRTMRSFDGMDWQPAHCRAGEDGWHCYSESTLRDLGRWQAAGVLDAWLSMPFEAPDAPVAAPVVNSADAWQIGTVELAAAQVPDGFAKVTGKIKVRSGDLLWSCYGSRFNEATEVEIGLLVEEFYFVARKLPVHEMDAVLAGDVAAEAAQLIPDGYNPLDGKTKLKERDQVFNPIRKIWRGVRADELGLQAEDFHMVIRSEVKA